jgi:hypothetical protein
MENDTEADKEKYTIIPPAPQTSCLDSAPNRLSRTIVHIRTGNWLCASYLKRVRKNRDEEISDKCWWCSKLRKSRTHSFLLFVCNLFVFSYVVPMTNYLLPSSPVQNTSLMGRIPRPPKYYTKYTNCWKTRVACV